MTTLNYQFSVGDGSGRAAAIRVLHSILEAGVQLRVESGALGWKSARGVLDPQQRDALKTHKPALLELLEPGVTYLPLLPAQRRIWLLCQFERGSTSYNMPAVTHLRGPLDVDALSRTFHEADRRFEAWRTSFPVFGGQPVQAIAPVSSAEEYSRLKVTDLRRRPAAERHSEAERLAAEFAGSAFNLERGPLRRFELLRLGEDEYWLLMNVHHLVCDRWALRLALHDIGRLYSAFVTKEEPDTASPPALGDFVLWNQRWQQSEACQTQIEYWQQRLHDIRPAAQLAPDFPRPQILSGQGETIELFVSPAQTEELTAIARRAGASLFAILLGAYGIANCQYSQRAEVRIGSAVANRNRPASRRVIGMLTNTLVLRFSVDESTPFLEWLRAINEQWNQDFAHQNAPFEMVAAALPEQAAPPSSPHHIPLFQTFFVMQNISMQRWELHDLEMRLRQNEAQTQTTKFDLTVSVYENEEQAGGLRIAFTYSTDLFARETVADFVGHYEHLLNAIAAEPEIEISRLPQPAQHRELPVAPNSAPENTPQGALPHSDTEVRLAALWKQALEVERVYGDDNFFDLGGHSMLAVQMLDAIETEFGKRLSLAAFFQAPTLRQQAALLTSQANEPGEIEISPYVVALRQSGSQPPLFCFEGAARYRDLAFGLGDDQPVYGLIYPEPLEEVWKDAAKVAEKTTLILQEIRAIQPHGPYFFAGLSKGGFEAYVMAKLLQQAGEQVPFLAMFDTYGPNYFLMSRRERLASHYAALRALDSNARRKYLSDRVAARLGKFRRDAPPANEDLPQPANAKARGGKASSFVRYLRRHRAQLSFDGEALLFVAQDKAQEFWTVDPFIGWKGYAANLEVFNTPGDHLTMMEKPQVEQLVAILAPRLQAAQERAQKNSATRTS